MNGIELLGPSHVAPAKGNLLHR